MTASIDTPMPDREVYKILRPTDCSPVYYEVRLKKHPNKEAISEYQAVFKKWPWQPPRESLAPYASRLPHDTKTKFSDVTTYRDDFLGLKLKKKHKKHGKKHELEDKQTQTEMRSDYNSTYNLEYYPKCAERSRPYTPCQSRINSITSGPDQSRPLSSYQTAYKQRDKLQTAGESDKEKEKEKKEDQDEIKKKQEEVETKPEPPESQNGKKIPKEDSEYISTAMADFRRHENIERRKPCYPVINDHFFHDKFDSQTSYAVTYRPHNITIPEKPLWGRKPVYKHPQGGMILESRYMRDYTDPKVIHPVAPIKPQAGMKNISGDGDIQMQPYTTYSLNYQEWKNARPATPCPQDFKLYEPPTEKMICESTQKEHFKGEYMIPRQPCRHISEHRLDDQVKRPMNFTTSYKENFKVPERPKSGPTAAEECRKFRIRSRAWRANI